MKLSQRFLKGTKSDTNLLDFEHFFNVKNKENAVSLFETQINQHLLCGLHKPSMFFSANNEPVSSSKRPLQEYAFFKLD